MVLAPRPARTRGALPGSDAPDHESTAKTPLIVDLDATLVTAHSEKARELLEVLRAGEDTGCPSGQTREKITADGG